MRKQAYRYVECTTRSMSHLLSRREFVGGSLAFAARSLRFGVQSLSELEQARLKLREEQAEAAKGTPEFLHDKLLSTTEQALERLHVQRHFVSTNDPQRVRRGEFSFHRDLEEDRIKWAEDVIRRVEPGPFEDPGYFAYLAYEAASFEMAFPALKEQFSRVLFGTVHEPTVDSFSDHTKEGNYAVIFMNSGLIDFFYQAAKASVEAQDPARTNDGGSFVTTDTDLKRVRDRLKINPAPVARLYRTLESYFYLGYPRAFSNERLLPEQSAILEALQGMTERWALAHEYGHGLALGIDFEKAPGSSARSEEFFADSNATILTVLSAATLDGMPPEIALAGGNFALACLEVARRAHSIVTTGSDDIDTGTESHPPSRERAEQSFAVFRRYFDVRYPTTGRGFDLSFVMRDSTPDGDSFGKDRAAQAYAPGNVLLAIWPFLRDQLLQQYKAKRPLHKMWSGI